MEPSELLELIRKGITTKDLNKKDVPALLVLFEKDLIYIEPIEDKFYHNIKEK